MKILTASEMGAADKRSVEAGVSVATLMENAGGAVARFVERRFAGETTGRVIVVLCGKGNNGGDGLVAARKLAGGVDLVRVMLLGAASELKGDAAAAWAKLVGEEDARFPVATQEVADEAALREALQDAELVIDAVVGTGFKPPLRGLAAVARDVLRESQVPVVAVDLPSGWDADSLERAAPEAFRADAVVTFAAPKLAHVFGHLTAPNVFGPVVVAPIGTPESAIVASEDLHWAGSSKSATEAPRRIDGNKGKFGHVLIVGGALGKAGAPSMASVAGLRAGAGLVTAAVPSGVWQVVAAVAPEFMLQPMEMSADAIVGEKLETLLKGISVVGIGPGLGTEPETAKFVEAFVERVDVPMVIDADALNILSGRLSVLKAAAKKPGRAIVLTPHPGEMARLAGLTVKEVEADRVGLARKFATEYGVTLVLKGWRTLIAHPDGRIAVNTTGNPSMAKGGSGDILTGIVSAMLGQYPDDVARAVEAAVFLHGLAGDFACIAQDEHTVLALDTVAHLAAAFRARVTDADEFTWIAGTAKQ